MVAIQQIIPQPAELDTFKYNDMTKFGILIEYYIKFSTEINDSLYNFIRNIILENEDPGTCDNNITSFLKYLDTIQFDIWFVDNYLFHLMINFYSFKKGIDLDNKPINQSFKEWCDRWYELYSRNTVMSRVTRNVIQPCQNRFIDRLFNPHTELGYSFGEKKRDELPWGN